LLTVSLVAHGGVDVAVPFGEDLVEVVGAFAGDAVLRVNGQTDVVVQDVPPTSNSWRKPRRPGGCLIS
jgi:hypothetical protein